MNKIMLSVIIGLIVLGGGTFAVLKTRSTPVAPTTTTPTPTATTSVKPVSPSVSTVTSPSPSVTKSVTQTPSAKTTTQTTTPTVATPEEKSFTVNAEDEKADLTTISVKKGTVVHLTFHVVQEQAYFGGLQFESTSPKLSTGVILPDQRKTLSFTADKSFDFTPYWGSSKVVKPYRIKIVVE